MSPQSNKARGQASKSPRPSLVEIGRVTRPLGVHGEMWVDCHAAGPAPYHEQHVLYVQDTPYQVESLKPRPRGIALKLRGIDSPEAVEPLRGLPVQVPEGQVPTLPSDTYYHFQIIGLKAVTADGRELGEVTEILERPGNDVYVVNGPSGEVLIPAIGDVVKTVDLERGLLVVEAIPGLL